MAGIQKEMIWVVKRRSASRRPGGYFDTRFAQASAGSLSIDGWTSMLLCCIQTWGIGDVNA